MNKYLALETGMAILLGVALVINVYLDRSAWSAVAGVVLGALLTWIFVSIVD